MADEDTTPESGGTPVTHKVWVGTTWAEPEEPHYYLWNKSTPKSDGTPAPDGSIVPADNSSDEYRGKYGSGKGSIGVAYLTGSAKSGLSADIDKREGELDLIKVEVTGSVVHAEGKGKLNPGLMLADVSSCLAGLTGIAPTAPPATVSAGSGGGPMAARISDSTAHGSLLAPGIGSSDVLIGGLPAWRATVDFHACPVVKGTTPDVGGTVAVGSPTVLINNMMACRVGDLVVETPGGPNPIVSGCPTVMIGDAGSGSGGEASAENQNSLALEGAAKLDIVTATVEGVLAGTMKDGKPLGIAKVGVMVAAVKGSVEGDLKIPLWGTHSLTLGGGLEGSAGSWGAEAGVEAGYSDEKGWHLETGAKAGLVAGIGVNFTIGFK